MPRERIATAPNGRANRFSAKSIETLSAARTLTYDEIERYNAVVLDAVSTARNVVLPAEEVCEGVYLLIANASSGAAALTIQNDAAGTVTVLQQNESGMVWCDGVTWRAITGAVNS